MGIFKRRVQAPESVPSLGNPITPDPIEVPEVEDVLDVIDSALEAEVPDESTKGCRCWG